MSSQDFLSAYRADIGSTKDALIAARRQVLYPLRCSGVRCCRRAEPCDRIVGKVKSTFRYVLVACTYICLVVFRDRFGSCCAMNKNVQILHKMVVLVQ